MEKLLHILNEIKPSIDFTKETDLVDLGIIDSLEIVMIITEIEKNFNITINPEDIDPDNFQSINSIWEMIQKLQ